MNELKNALPYVANETQQEMTNQLAQGLETGDMQSLKKSQSLWVQDAGPVVETSVGFLESYQDPHGVRASWQGLVAIVNKPQTAVLDKLIEESDLFISRLPWNTKAARAPNSTRSEFENPSFKRPDYTSLDGQSHYSVPFSTD